MNHKWSISQNIYSCCTIIIIKILNKKENPKRWPAWKAETGAKAAKRMKSSSCCCQQLLWPQLTKQRWRGSRNMQGNGVTREAQVRPRRIPGEWEKSLNRRTLLFHTVRLAMSRTTEVAKRTQLGLVFAAQLIWRTFGCPSGEQPGKLLKIPLSAHPRQPPRFWK